MNHFLPAGLVVEFLESRALLVVALDAVAFALQHVAGSGEWPEMNQTAGTADDAWD